MAKGSARRKTQEPCPYVLSLSYCGYAGFEITLQDWARAAENARTATVCVEFLLLRFVGPPGVYREILADERHMPYKFALGINCFPIRVSFIPLFRR